MIFCRLQFLELQLELIDDWRVRLLQLLHQNCEDPLNSLIPNILNSVNYVLNVLMEWGVTVVCIQYLYLLEINGTEIFAANLNLKVELKF